MTEYDSNVRTVMNPHSYSGWKKFFPNVPDMAARVVRKGGGGSRTKNALIESSLRFARPASRTSTEVVGSSDKRDATTRPAVCTCELTGRVRRGSTYSTACCTD